MANNQEALRAEDVMRIVAVLVAMFALTALAKSQEPAPRPPDGTVVAQTSCQFAEYAEASAFTKHYYSRQEYTAVSKSTAATASGFAT